MLASIASDARRAPNFRTEPVVHHVQLLSQPPTRGRIHLRFAICSLLFVSLPPHAIRGSTHRYSTSTIRLNVTSIVAKISTTPMIRNRSLF